MAAIASSAGMPGRAWFQRPRSAAVALTVGCVLLGSGCGGSPAPGVASVATAKAGTRPGGSPAASDKGDPAAFSACMRRHGVEDFPDPDSSGRIKITSGQSSTGQKTGVDTGSPQFAAAQQACHGLLPNGGKPSAAEQQKAIQQALKFAQCMRSHGVSKFPDPEVVDGGGIKQTVDGSLNPGAPQFRAAQQSCQKLVPGGPTSDGPPPGATP